MEKCSVCGREGADILCGRCGRVVCEGCYDDGAGMCVRCTSRSRGRGGPSRPRLLAGGLALILLGLMVTSWSFILSGEATVVLFPFVLSGLNAPATIALSLVFFALFAASSILPLYLLLRRSEYAEWDEGIYSIHDSVVSGGSSSESVELMITTEVPGGLRESIYIEEGDDKLTLLSSKDPGFVKSYDIPDAYYVDDVESDYEGGFLLIRVRLAKDD